MKKMVFCLFSVATCFGQWDGNYYADHSKMQFDTAVQVFRMLPIESNSRILDIGCGDGRITKYIADLVSEGSVIGLDKSASMIKKAEKYAGGNLAFLVADVTQIPLSSQFDYIVSFNCLQWVKEIDLALESINQLLLPTGKALFLLAPKEEKYLLQHIIDEVAHKDKWVGYFSSSSVFGKLYSKDEWVELVKKASMNVEEVKTIPIRFDYSDKQKFADWIAGWVPCGTMLKEQKKEFVDEIVQEYLKIVPCENNGIVHHLMDEIVILCGKNES